MESLCFFVGEEHCFGNAGAIDSLFSGTIIEVIGARFGEEKWEERLGKSEEAERNRETNNFFCSF